MPRHAVAGVAAGHVAGEAAERAEAAHAGHGVGGDVDVEVCPRGLCAGWRGRGGGQGEGQRRRNEGRRKLHVGTPGKGGPNGGPAVPGVSGHPIHEKPGWELTATRPVRCWRRSVEPPDYGRVKQLASLGAARQCESGAVPAWSPSWRSEEHTSELQSLMRISYAVF